ncbi:MAG: ABC transporter substrate-binding protein [Gammaproteobacteria bacterium]
MISRVSRFFILCVVLAGFHSPAMAMAPDEVVKETANGVLDRIKQEREILQANPEKLYALIDQLVIPNFDFISMSKWVLGNNWKSASDAQRTEFVEQFKTLLVNTYAKALLEYSDQEIKFYPTETTDRPNLAVVRTELTGGAQPFPVAYRMYQKNDRWKVVDVTVDGVSLVSTYRGSFATQIKKEGFDSLLKQLADKNARLEGDLKGGS